MKDVDYMSVAEESMAKIRKGAFLTVQSEKGLNTLTIGWAMFGVIWRRPIMQVAIRPSRYTFGIIETAQDFTVTVPAGDMSEQTRYCGSHSGRDVDKFKECGLQTAKSQRVASPIIQVPGIHYECRIVYKTAMDPSYFDKEIATDVYPQKDFSKLFFGEILACYKIG